jgi:hypothetical protein
MRVDSQFFHGLRILKYNFEFLIRFWCLWSWFLLLTILFTALPANRHTLAPGIMGFLIMRVPKSDAQRNICLVSGINFIYPLVYTSKAKHNRFCHIYASATRCAHTVA